MMTRDELPLRDDCNAKKLRGGRLTALEQFILDNEPQSDRGDREETFYSELFAVIHEIEEKYEDCIMEIECCA